LKSVHATVFYRCFWLSGSFTGWRSSRGCPASRGHHTISSQKDCAVKGARKKTNNNTKLLPRNAPSSVVWVVEAYALKASEIQREINNLYATTLQTTNKGRAQRNENRKPSGRQLLLAGQTGTLLSIQNQVRPPNASSPPTGPTTGNTSSRPITREL
jgi:hypothetical protein